MNFMHDDKKLDELLKNNPELLKHQECCDNNVPIHFEFLIERSYRNWENNYIINSSIRNFIKDQMSISHKNVTCSINCFDEKYNNLYEGSLSTTRSYMNSNNLILHTKKQQDLYRILCKKINNLKTDIYDKYDNYIICEIPYIIFIIISDMNEPSVRDYRTHDYKKIIIDTIGGVDWIFYMLGTNISKHIKNIQLRPENSYNFKSHEFKYKFNQSMMKISEEILDIRKKLNILDKFSPPVRVATINKNIRRIGGHN